MKYEICIADPAGNKTAFVKTRVLKEDYVKLANKIMEKEEYEIEQVGYIVSPINNGAGRLEMMGNEFCGNAARSFGLLLVSRNKNLNPVINIEISGADDTLEVTTDLINSTAQVAMPLLKDFSTIEDNGVSYPVVVLEGITHVIIEDKEVSEELVNNIINKMKITFDFEALGLMFVEEETMYPIVYVVETGSIVHEGSCGSGTIAYAYYLTNLKADGNYSFHIKQPKGTIIAHTKKKDDKIISGLIDGKVSLTDFFEIEVD